MGDKVPNDPMHRPLPMHQSPRCGARTRKREPVPVARGEGKRCCRMHKAWAGPPLGNRNA